MTSLTCGCAGTHMIGLELARRFQLQNSEVALLQPHLDRATTHALLGSLLHITNTQLAGFRDQCRIL